MKYIVFDLDDTLLDHNREITAFTKDVLKKLQALGHKLVINTARSKHYSQEYLHLLCPDYAIYNGGAHIIDKNEKTIYRAEIDIPTTQMVISELLNMTENFSVQTEEFLYSHKGSYTGQDAKAFDFSKDKFLMPAMKIVASITDGEKAEQIAKKFGLEYTSYFGGPFRRYNHPDATKAKGNENLVRLTGGSIADVIAFGDDHGDIEMLQQAGIGVLMKNAKPEFYGEVALLSEYTNDEDGVARFLVEYFQR